MRQIGCLSRRSLRFVSHASAARANTPALLGRSGLCTSSGSFSPPATFQGKDAPSGRPLRVCVVGSGPAGFYVTKYLLKEEAELGCNLAIDIVDKLPTPFGLVRFGVAPDHPEVKAVQNDFDQVASDPRVSFFGNVCFGRDISVEELSELYDVVVLAYGAAGDRKLTVPGADLKGVFAARSFVSWYNGHPEFAHMSEEFGEALASSDTVAVVGVGNVALDCARILAKGADGLRETDICEHTLDVLSSAGASLRRVVILGRRGYVQASFTIKELRELTRLDGVACVVRQDELELSRTPASLDELKTTRAKNRIDALLAKMAGESRNVSADAKAVELRFLAGLSEILPSDQTTTRVGAVRVERNKLEVDGTTGAQHASGTGDTDEVIGCGMVLGSIGYRCLPVEGVPYDERNSVIANDRGRVPGMPGMYCSGWARRGPSGIIGTNIADARSVVAAIVEDISREQLASGGKADDRRGLSSVVGDRQNGAPGLLGSRIAEGADMKRVQIVDWDGYQRIDRDEIARGAARGKPREKIVDFGEMLDIARAERHE
ncbi:unnamed protein product [Scytosiphon promiscuus]